MGSVCRAFKGISGDVKAGVKGLIQRRHANPTQTFGYLADPTDGAAGALDGPTRQGLGIVDKLDAVRVLRLRLLEVSHAERKRGGHRSGAIGRLGVRESDLQILADALMARVHAVFELDPLVGAIKVVHLHLLRWCAPWRRA